MEARKNNQLATLNDRFVLRWSERFDSTLQEEMVDLVLWNLPNPVIRSVNCLPEKTQVYLSGRNYTGSGIVYSCRREDSGYLLTLAMSADTAFMSPRQQFDPGLLAVDNFLTEEEENKILENLGNEVPYRVLMRIAAWLQALWNLPRRAWTLLLPLYSL